VGTNDTDHREYAYKKKLRRNDKIKTVVNIDQTEVWLANPFGGAV